MFDKGKSWRVQSVLKLVHSDLVGQFLVPSFGKSRYALTFIDDYSCYTWVFFMAHKSEVFEQFLNFKAQVEKQSEKAIKNIQTDNGGEYVNLRLIDFCTQVGIDLQHSVPYMP